MATSPDRFTGTNSPDRFTSDDGGGGASGVSSFNGRTGAVSPAQADYDSFFLTPAEGDALFLTPAEGDARYAQFGSALTQGSVLFADAAGKIEDDNANFFWDNTNKFLGIGTATPGAPIEIRGASATLGVLRFTDPDIATGATDQFPTDVYASVQQKSALIGGLRITAIGDATGISTGVLDLRGIQGGDTTNPCIVLHVGRISGTTYVNNGTSRAALQVRQFDETVLLGVFGDGQLVLGSSAEIVANTKLQVTGAANQRTAVFRGNATGTANIVEAQNSAGTIQFSVSSAGVINAATSYQVAGTKVVGTQGAAVADASGGATIDAEARTALNALLARVRAHGLIAT